MRLRGGNREFNRIPGELSHPYLEGILELEHRSSHGKPLSEPGKAQIYRVVEAKTVVRIQRTNDRNEFFQRDSSEQGPVENLSD